MNEKDIAEFLKVDVAPILAVDGGEIEVVTFDDTSKRVHIRFGGTYVGSPCQGIVLKYIVEPILKKRFEELESVEMVD